MVKEGQSKLVKWFIIQIEDLKLHSDIDMIERQIFTDYKIKLIKKKRVNINALWHFDPGLSRLQYGMTGMQYPVPLDRESEW